MAQKFQKTSKSAKLNKTFSGTFYASFETKNKFVEALDLVTA